MIAIQELGKRGVGFGAAYVEARAQFYAELSDSQCTRASSFRVLHKTHTI